MLLQAEAVSRTIAVMILIQVLMRFCLLHRNSSIEDLDADPKHRRHWHISRNERDELLADKVAEWLSKRRGILRITREYSRKGSSARFGGYLAAALRRGEEWALVFRDNLAYPTERKGATNVSESQGRAGCTSGSSG
jgi:hypothetical protein